MSTETATIRVPRETRDRLVARARERGVSLSSLPTEFAAPAEVGRGFARLLNIADGLLGQGSRALILITTNEPLGKLYPATLRPGRAMATLEFTPLAAAEASAWLAARGLERRIGVPATIAELHAILAGTAAAATPTTRAPVGFA
jgi:hypothetical protein